jgi:WD40 repeat protein
LVDERVKLLFSLDKSGKVSVFDANTLEKKDELTKALQNSNKVLSISIDKNSKYYRIAMLISKKNTIKIFDYADEEGNVITPKKSPVNSGKDISTHVPCRMVTILGKVIIKPR